MTFDKNCWLECVKLGANGSDPEGCKLRPDEGLSAIGELSPGSIYTPASTSVFTNMVKYLSNLGYDVNGIIGLPYDWRLSPGELEIRDSFLSNIKYKLETAVKRHKRPAIILAHSMGNNLFMYFCEWMKHRVKPVGGYEKWFKAHVWAYVGFAAPLLGAPGSLKGVLSGHPLGLSISQAQARDMTLTFTSSHMVNPRDLPKGSTGVPTSSSSHDALSSSTSTTSSTKLPAPRMTAPDYSHHIDPIVSFKSLSGSTNISFGIKDIENGQIFNMVGNLCRDPKLVAKFTTLRDLYLEDSLKPLGNFDRPPIRHVMMVYGVDMPSEVGYSYLIPEGQASDTSSALDPILDEIYMEEPCESKEEVSSSKTVDNTGDNSDHNGRNNKVNDNNSGISTLEINLEEDVTREHISTSIEPPRRQQERSEMTYDADNQASQIPGGDGDDQLPTKPLSYERPLTTTSWDGITTTEPEVDDDYNTVSAAPTFSLMHITESLTSTLSVFVGTLGAIFKTNVVSGAATIFHHGIVGGNGSYNQSSDQCNNSQISKEGNGALIKSDGSATKDSHSKNMGSNGAGKRECKSYIYAIKNKDPYQKAGSTKLTDAEKAMLKGGKDKKRFVRRGAQDRTGDFTIPYISLSFAHTWLSNPKTQEHRPEVVHKAWGDGKRGGAAAAVGMGVTVDPAVTIFESNAPTKSGETTAVIEVERIDHLDIVKHPYVHSVVFEKLLSLMAKEFSIEE